MWSTKKGKWDKLRASEEGNNKELRGGKGGNA
jgi:hypothetical protein